MRVPTATSARKRIRDAQHLLTSFRSRAETLQLLELDRARQRLSNGEDADEVLQAFARALTNKLIHEPTIAIREASAEGHHEMLDYVRALYGLDKPD